MIKNKFILPSTIVAILATSAFALYRCGQDLNSNSGDEALDGKLVNLGACELPADKRRCNALTVIQTRCAACHGDWSGYSSDQDWVNSGLVMNGSPDSSELITKTINAGGDMPQNGSALPDSEYASIRDWIQQMDLTVPTVETK